MALENLVGADKYLSALQPTNPVGADDKREGDDHIRGIKNTLKNTFPNLTGPVTATQGDLSTPKVNRAGDTMSGALQVADTLTAQTAASGAVKLRLVQSTVREWSIGQLGGEGSLRFTDVDGAAEVLKLSPVGGATLKGNLAVDGEIVAGTQAAGSMYQRLAGAGGFGVFNHFGTFDAALFLGFSLGGTIIGTIDQNSSSGVRYNTTSDYRLKADIQPLAGSGAFIDALQPRQGLWKADGSRFVGFIAHELQAVAPGAVSGQKDGEQMQAVAYGAPELIANIVAELQSLRARVAQLERFVVL